MGLQMDYLYAYNQQNHLQAYKEASSIHSNHKFLKLFGTHQTFFFVGYSE